MQWRYRHSVLVIAVFGNFTQLGSRILISPLVPQIIETFDTTKSVIGVVLTGLWVIYALAQFPSGLLGDRFGEKRVVLAALVGTGVGSLLVAGAPTFSVFGLALLVMGLSAGLYYSVAASILSSLFSNQGQALSFHTAGGAVAGLVIPVIAAQISLAFDWRAALVLGAAIAFPVAALFAWRVRPTPPAHPDVPPWRRTDTSMLRGILSRRQIAYTILLSIVGVFTFQSFGSFFPTFLIEYRGLSTSVASLAFGAIFFLSAVVQPLIGRLSDVAGRDGATALSMGLSALGYVVVLLAPGTAALVASVALLGLGMSWGGVLQARLMDYLTDDERNLGFGFVRTVYMVIGASGSVVTGTVADAAGWLPAFGIVIGLLSVAVGSLAVSVARSGT